MPNELKHEYPGGWKLTDDDCAQYVRRVGPRTYELVQYESYFYDTPRIEVYADTICLEDYKEDEIAEILHSYDYDGVEDVWRRYGSHDAANQIIAECVFEHYLCMANEPLVTVATEEEAIAVVGGYLEANHAFPADHWKMEVSLDDLAERIVSLEIGESLTFYDAAENDSYGVTRQRCFDADVLIINYFGGGNPYIIDVERQHEYAQAHVLDGLKRYCEESDIEAVYVDTKSSNTAAEQYRGIDPDKLPDKTTVLKTLEEYENCDRGITHLREQYEESIGFDPIWREHLGDDWYSGALIMPVREGILYIPYDDVYASEGDWEIFVTEKASLLDADSTEYMLKLTEDYMNEYMVLLRHIVSRLREEKAWPFADKGGRQ